MEIATRITPPASSEARHSHEQSQQINPQNNNELPESNQVTPAKDTAKSATHDSANDNAKDSEKKKADAQTRFTQSVKPDPKEELGFSDSEIKLLEKLKSRDREVRAHEAAHLAVAGQYATGGPVFEYQSGPDGNRYAIGGHVNISASPIAGDPEATLQKAEQIQRAAMAPAEPSTQDMRVAAKARAMAADARADIQQMNAEKFTAQQDAKQAVDNAFSNKIDSNDSAGDESEGRSEAHAPLGTHARQKAFYSIQALGGADNHSHMSIVA